MAVRKIIQIGHPALRRKNKEIKNFKSRVFKKLQKDLIDSMYKADLVGIAAPQIAKNYMVFATHIRKTRARKLSKSDKLRFFVNPKITFESKKKSIIYEGCGSVVDGKLFGPVARSKEIEIIAFDENEIKFKLRCDGILARVVLHEMGHLDGEEFIGKISDYSKMVLREFYIKNIRNSKTQIENSKITKIETTLIL